MGVITAKQERFCQEYVVDLNATQALIRAGYSARGAKQTANHLLTKPDLLALVDKLKKERADKIGVTAEMVVKELAKLAFTDLVDVVDITKNRQRLKTPLEGDRVKLGAIAEITEITNGAKTTRRIKMHDKKGALELLGRHLGMFNDKLSLPVSGEVIHKIERVIVDSPGVKVLPAPVEARSHKGLPS